MKCGMKISCISKKAEQIKRLEWKGYMTVEAALVLSIVFAVYVFLIQSFMWIYDRCVLEQDMATLVLRCVNVQGEKPEQVWQRVSAELVPEKYLWVELQKPQLKQQGWKWEVHGSGKAECLSDIQITYEVWSFTPTQWLRWKHKIAQHREIKNEGEEEK